MNRRALATILFVFAAGCLGGQSKQAKSESAGVGDQSGDVPATTLHQHDWKEAAEGHDAAGPIPIEDLARMDEASAPGRRAQRDAGSGPR